MATDFKTPEKFVFDHSKNKQSDKLRQLLGLVYGLGTEVDLIEIFKKSAVDPYIDFTQVIGGGDVPEFVVSRNQNKFGGSDIDQINAETSLIKAIENHINQVNELDSSNNFFEDFNFKIDKNLLKGFSVQTVVRDLQESDIQEGNSDYPGGKLNPNKKETSLKFAYAFETIKIQGEEQIVAKKVKLVNGADDLIKRANNENNNDLEIKQLQNLFYITSQDDEMNAQIIGEGSESNFDLDKIYNIIKIDLAAIKDPKETQNSIYSFSPYLGSPAINGFVGLEDLPVSVRQGTDYYNFLEYVVVKIFKGNQSVVYPYLPENSFNLFGYGLSAFKDKNDDSASAEELYQSFSQDDLKDQPTNALESLKTAFSQQQIRILSTLDFQKSSIDEYNLKPDYIVNNMALSLPLKDNYKLINVTHKFQSPDKSPLRNYTEADLFRSAQKTNGNFVFSFGERNDNLLRPAFPVGLRLVKSTKPYDPDNTSLFNSSILQTFYIPLEANPNENQIRLFDSQIIYGKTYYYTLFGIYYVDGKIYFYPHIEINKAKEKTNSVKIETKENKVYRKEIIVNGNNINTSDVVDDSQKVYKNPCCEYNYFSPTIFYDSFINPLRNTRPSVLGNKESRKKSIDNFIGSIKGINPGLSVETEKSLNDLANIGWEFGAYITDPGLKGDDIQIYNLINLNSSYINAGPSIQKAFNCFICREKNTFAAIRATKNSSFTTSNSSLVIKVEKAIISNGTKNENNVYGLIGKQSVLATNLIDCTEFGWDTIYGALDANQTNPPQASLENFGGGKDKSSKEIYTDGISEVFGPLSPVNYPRCIREDRTSIFTEKFKDFKFELFESNARRTYEIPLLPSLENSVVSLIPLPPIVEFVPLADINNRIKIKFQESAASGFTIVQVDEAVKILNGGDTYEKIVNRSKEEAKENGLSLGQDAATLELSELLARSEGDIKEIYAFKLDRVPTSLQDLIDNGERFILDYKSGKTAYFSNVLPNEKYYYTFVSRDVTGLFSTATETFQVEIVEDSGYVYTKIDLYDYVTKEIKVTTKEFQKLLKIKPSFKNMLPKTNVNPTWLGGDDGYDTVYSEINFGGESDTQPPKFKIRIRSKKTNRVFDINLKYSQDIKEVTSKKLIEQLKKVSELVSQKKVKKNN